MQKEERGELSERGEIRRERVEDDTWTTAADPCLPETCRDKDEVVRQLTDWSPAPG